MKTMFFTQAADDALAQAMAEDSRIVVFWRRYSSAATRPSGALWPQTRARYTHQRKRLFRAGVAAAMAGLRPVVEMYMVDFLAFA